MTPFSQYPEIDNFLRIDRLKRQIPELITDLSIYRVHFLGTLRVLQYRDTIDRVLFYIEMTIMMS